MIPISKPWDYSSGMNWIFTEHLARERQQALLAEMQNNRLANLEHLSVRVRLAHWLRITADKLEPICRDAINPKPEMVSSK